MEDVQHYPHLRCSTSGSLEGICGIDNGAEPQNEYKRWGTHDYVVKRDNFDSWVLVARKLDEQWLSCDQNRRSQQGGVTFACALHWTRVTSRDFKFLTGTGALSERGKGFQRH